MDFVQAMTPAVLLLVDAALKGAILVGVAALAAYLLRHRSAAARHAVWTAAMAGHLALPVLALVAPEWRIPLVAAPAWISVFAPTLSSFEKEVPSRTSGSRRSP